MATDNWINLIAAILVGGGTLALAFMTWKSIRQSRRIHEDEHQHSLLDEIIKWADDVAGWNFKLYNFIEAQIAKESWVESSIGEIVSQFQIVEAKGGYINTIVLSSFKGKRKLLSAVKAVNKEIRELVDISMKRLDGKVATEAVTEHMNLLRSKITELLKETAKIKTNDIGKKEENMSNEEKSAGDNGPTLKDIEEHLKRQDKQTNRMIYFAGAAFGASIILVAISLWIGRIILSTTAFFWEYIYLVAIGFGFMSWCWYKQRKIKG